MTNEQVENVMAIAFELARIREEHGAQSGMYLSEVRALRAEAERLAAQAAPTEPNSDLPTYTDDLELRYAEVCEERDHLRAVLRAQSPAQAPVVQAVQAVELIEQEMAMLIRRLCSTTANDKTRAQAMEYLFKRGHASPLRADSVVASLTAQRDAALARVAELEKDAARYRWLRSVPNAFKAQRIVNDTPHGMDATIDAAMNGGNQ